MASPSSPFIAMVNDLIVAFNERDIAAFDAQARVAMDQELKKIFDAIDESIIKPLNLISCLGALRGIACEIASTESMLRIDTMLQWFLSAGIPQATAERDREFRACANGILTAWNAQNDTEAKSLLHDWTEMCGTEPVVSHAQEDCFAPLIQTAKALEMADVVSELDALQADVAAQKALLTTSQELMPAVNFLAIDYPHIVTIETFMKCNAKCHFCPYPEMEQTSDRANVRMSEELFAKIIDDLTDIPSKIPLQMNLSRVNEPFLDHRIFDFMDMIEEKLPQAHLFMPSNASTLNAKNLSKLTQYTSFKKLMVSLNHHEKEGYEATMGLSYERTIANLDTLHALRESGEAQFGVVLTTVMELGETWESFAAWCKERYPRFLCDRYPPTNWFGMTENESGPILTQPSSCKDWYQVHILADGTEAQCCFDAEGKFGHGNVADMHILDLYNKDWQRQLRRTGAIRQSDMSPGFCQACDYV